MPAPMLIRIIGQGFRLLGGEGLLAQWVYNGVTQLSDMIAQRFSIYF